MVLEQRRQLHHATAAWYERNQPGDGSLYALLAYHWTKAEVLPKALHYLDLAGQDAVRDYANREALYFYSEALRLAATMDDAGPLLPGPDALPARLQRAVWESNAGLAHAFLGSLAGSREHNLRAVALFGHAMPAGGWRLNVSLIGAALTQLAHLMSLRPFRRRAAADQLAAVVAAGAYNRLVGVYMYGNAPRSVALATLRQVNLAECAPPSGQLAEAYAAMPLLVKFWPRLARRYNARAVATLAAVDEPRAAAIVSLLQAWYYLGVGQLEDLRATLPPAIAALEAAANYRQWEKCVSLLATGMLYMGDLEQALPRYADAHNSAERRGDAQNQIGNLAGRGACLVYLGHAREALPLLDRALELLTQHPEVIDWHFAARLPHAGLLAAGRPRGHRRRRRAVPGGDSAHAGAAAVGAAGVFGAGRGLPGADRAG